MVKTVKFRHFQSPYNVGDVATFEDFVADRLIKLGYAEVHRQTLTERQPVQERKVTTQMKDPSETYIQKDKRPIKREKLVKKD